MSVYAVLAIIAAVEIIGVIFAVALCRAAADRPEYGPPLQDTTPRRRRGERRAP